VLDRAFDVAQWREIFEDAVGLPASAKGADVLTAVHSAIAAKPQVDPTRFVPVEQVTALQTEINSLKGRMDGDAAETAVNKAISDGKLAPALKSWALDYHKADPAKFKEFVDGSPVLTSAQRASAIPPNNSGEPELTDEDTAVMKQLGLTKEAFLKTKKAGDE
jgi:phage I-like protein